MKPQYFGDSYDIVKKAFIRWLSEFGPWVTHPIFTEDVSSVVAEAFSRLIGTQLLSSRTLTSTIDRAEYFSVLKGQGNLFLDPDTGVSLKRLNGAKSVRVVFGDELVKWSLERPHALTLIFDQSYSRSVQKEVAMREKLNYFADRGVYGFIYDSHATLLLLSGDKELVERAGEKLIREGLPDWRLFRGEANRPAANAPKPDAVEFLASSVASQTCTGKQCGRPDENYIDPRIRQRDLVQLEEVGSFWLWAWPELLNWKAPIRWLFSPCTGRDRWPGDLWGVDDEGELIIVEAKRSTAASDPFNDFLYLERRRMTGEFAPPTLADIRARWEPLLQSELQFLQANYDALRSGTGRIGLAPGVVPYSAKRIIVWRWRQLYLDRIAPLIMSPSYRDLCNSALEKWAKRGSWAPNYFALFTILNSAPPRFSAVGKRNREELIQLTPASHVHARAIECSLISETNVQIDCRTMEA